MLIPALIWDRRQTSLSLSSQELRTWNAVGGRLAACDLKDLNVEV